MFKQDDVVECINNSDAEEVFSHGRRYTVVGMSDNEVKLKGVPYTWSTSRFKLVSKAPTKKSKYVRCLDNSGSRGQQYLKVGHAYEVSYDYGDEWAIVVEGSGATLDFMKSRFSPVLDDFDPVEDKVRRWLTTPIDPDKCKSCGAPKSKCTYHP